MNAKNINLPKDIYDGAFLCWVLEHIPEPIDVLLEVKKVLKPKSKIYVTEVMNSSFFLEPYSPNLWKYWMAFNDYQYDHAGDPFIGAKLGNLLTEAGYQDIQTDIKTWHFDKRNPGERARIISFWKDLLFSAAQQLIDAEYVEKSMIEEVRNELNIVEADPNAVFMYSFMQANAVS